MAKIELPALISNGMVLQRDVENIIWGYGKPGKTMRLYMGAYQTANVIGEDGYFELKLPKIKEGGPWEMLLSDGEDRKRITDIFFGDVFVLGGQSNMELPIERTLERYGEEIENTVESEIRMFEVPKEYAFGYHREEIEKGEWIKAEGSDLLKFSAVGYFAAKELKERSRIPIGLLQTAVGGTPLKAWTSADTIRDMGYDAMELEECTKEGHVEETEKRELERDLQWRKDAFDVTEKGGRCGSLKVPGFLEETELKDFYGSIRLKKTILVPEFVDVEKMDGKLYFGAIIDADTIYVNGEKIGETGYRYPPRIYPVPAKLLKTGENVIEIEMMIFRNGGGFMPGMRYELCCGEWSISLEGDWEYEVVREMEVLPDMTFFQYKAAGLYQGMLYPLRKYQVKGCFFYQGESNTGRPETYEEEFSRMIGDWRTLWKNPELPFVYVQLAGFADGKKETTGTNWAKVREAQKRAQKIPGTKMAQAYDLGEYNELHPTDKKTVGKRVALAAEQIIYGKQNEYENIEVAEINWMPEEVEISFGGTETVLHTKNETKVCGFTYKTEEGWKRVTTALLAEEKKNTVRLKFPETKKVKAIAYAWNDCPLEANLYNEAEMPLTPFVIMQ